MIDDQCIASKRLLLRPLEVTDAARLHALINDWNVLRTLASPPYPYRREHAEEFLAAAMQKHASGRAAVFAIAQEEGLIGIIAIEPDERGPRLGYWLGRAYWGRGYMSEAAAALVHHHFRFPGNDRLVSGYFAGNGASWRIQDKLGFRFVGERMLHSRPWGKELPHIDTLLTRERFETLFG
ncbi:MAG TPA: GNAT family N-acetyltransferase [Hyphomicrobiaceae bacterium]|nr:GNAT family N-acetyltransferase [Hyphomicrobiaceae bacterium]